MKKINLLLKKNDASSLQKSLISAIPTGKKNLDQQPISDHVKSLVNMLFARFMVIYGHKFKSSFETDQELNIAKREWAQSLGNYPEDVLVRALELAKKQYAWMPSIAEFLQLIHQVQTQFGLPTPHDAFIEACCHAREPMEHKWSHSAVYYAGKKTGWYDLRTQTKTWLEAKFSRYYTDLCNQILGGKNLAMPADNALPNAANDDLIPLISHWGEVHNIDNKTAQSLLYYLHLSKQNPVREQLRKRAQSQITHMPLPTDIQQLRDM